MANQQNIDPYKFQKGQSGNPKGRPPGIVNLTSILRDFMEKKVKINKNAYPWNVDGDKVTVREALMAKLVAKGLSGDLNALQCILDRMDGKSLQSIEIKEPENVYKDKEVLDEIEAIKTSLSG